MAMKFLSWDCISICGNADSHRRDNRGPEAGTFREGHPYCSCPSAFKENANCAWPTANYRKLARANLLAHPISMIGQVVVDGAADNVSTIDGGKGLLYDSTPEQRMWARWAAGDFSAEDEETAGIWRNGIEQIDLDGVIKVWKEFSLKHLATTKNQNELIAALNAFLSDPSPTKQREILEMALNLAKSIEPERRFALALQRIGEMPSVNEFAPYAVSVLRLFLAFVCGLARGFVGPRPTNYIDLQYLYYAPFCMGFCSQRQISARYVGRYLRREQLRLGARFEGRSSVQACCARGSEEARWNNSISDRLGVERCCTHGDCGYAKEIPT